MLDARYDTILAPLSIDVSTGDAITPHAVEFSFNEIFDDSKSFRLWAYNIETVLAEKVETILRRTVFNTRPRDFYDAYILATTQKYDKALFSQACKQPPNTGEQQSKLQTCPASCKISQRVPPYKPYGTSIAGSLPTPKISHLPRLSLFCGIFAMG